MPTSLEKNLSSFRLPKLGAAPISRTRSYIFTALILLLRQHVPATEFSIFSLFLGLKHNTVFRLSFRGATERDDEYMKDALVYNTFSKTKNR